MGIAGAHLEMLFVAPEYFRRSPGARFVGVSEQNLRARHFYAKHGFRAVSRAQTDCCEISVLRARRFTSGRRAETIAAFFMREYARLLVGNCSKIRIPSRAPRRPSALHRRLVYLLQVGGEELFHRAYAVFKF